MCQVRSVGSSLRNHPLPCARFRASLRTSPGAVRIVWRRSVDVGTESTTTEPPPATREDQSLASIGRRDERTAAASALHSFITNVSIPPRACDHVRIQRHRHRSKLPRPVRIVPHADLHHLLRRHRRRRRFASASSQKPLRRSMESGEFGLKFNLTPLRRRTAPGYTPMQAASPVQAHRGQGPVIHTRWAAFPVRPLTLGVHQPRETRTQCR